MARIVANLLKWKGGRQGWLQGGKVSRLEEGGKLSSRRRRSSRKGGTAASSEMVPPTEKVDYVAALRGGPRWQRWVEHDLDSGIPGGCIRLEKERWQANSATVPPLRNSGLGPSMPYPMHQNLG